MPHFRLRTIDDPDGDGWECDQPTVPGALADFGHQLGEVLALQGDVGKYVMQSRETGGDEADFRKAVLTEVFVVGGASK